MNSLRGIQLIFIILPIIILGWEWIGVMSKEETFSFLDSAYLYHDIDWAFKVWQEQPWAKNISFETFCEYLLPYRIGDEPLSYWRKTYHKKYNSLMDSLRMPGSSDIEAPVVATTYLISKWPDKSHYDTSVTPSLLGPINEGSIWIG